MMIGRIEPMAMDWYAVRMRPLNNRGRRTVELGAKRETYTGRDGQTRVRKLKGTGQKRFVHEVILRRNGFEVFLPVKLDWRQKHRCTKEKHLMAFPLLADWLFVGWPAGTPRWEDLMSLDVVCGVLGTGGRPIRVSETRMARLMAQWGGGRAAPEHRRYQRTHAEYDVGDRVRVAVGSLEGQEVSVVSLEGSGARVALQLFGRDVQMTLQADVLEPVLS
ncbi:transcription termination/antitermination protein NusG [Shimia sp.]|uniref:transcription termination/antitermination protein NusG n=1 Tax=Shimia sp. TaxID=1954381 RepID=UPI003B8BA970